MELRTLRYFVAVAEELHFGRAARRVNISQPPLSLQIRRLEEELGTRLFERTKRMVKLTPAGKFFLESARLILRQAESAIEGVRAAEAGIAGQLSIGMINSFSFHSKVFDTLLRFRSRHPGIALTLKIMTSVDQIEALNQGQIHIGFLRAPVKEKSLWTSPVMTEQLFVALPRDHQLASTDRPIDVRSLAQEPFVMLPRAAGYGLSEQTLQICRRAGFFPKVVQNVAEPQLITGLVEAGFGVAFVPATSRLLPRDRIVYRSIKPRQFAEVVVACPKTNRSRGTDEFLEVLRQQIGRSPIKL